MNKELFLITATLLIMLTSSVADASSLKIVGPYAVLDDSDIIVNTGITNVKELETVIGSGIEKELIFTIELLRSWNFWPDEFISSKKMKKVIQYDNLREEYRASAVGDDVMSEYQFKDFPSMNDWLSNIGPLVIGSTKGLEKGKYYIRVVIESKSRKYPMLIGIIMHLIPEIEMSLAKESAPFTVGEGP